MIEMQCDGTEDQEKNADDTTVVRDKSNDFSQFPGFRAHTLIFQMTEKLEDALSRHETCSPPSYKPVIFGIP